MNAGGATLYSRLKVLWREFVSFHLLQRKLADVRLLLLKPQLLSSQRQDRPSPEVQPEHELRRDSTCGSDHNDSIINGYLTGRPKIITVIDIKIPINFFAVGISRPGAASLVCSIHFHLESGRAGQ
jgi:hypothetical protein